MGFERCGTITITEESDYNTGNSGYAEVQIESEGTQQILPVLMVSVGVAILLCGVIAFLAPDAPSRSPHAHGATRIFDAEYDFSAWQKEYDRRVAELKPTPSAKVRIRGKKAWLYHWHDHCPALVRKKKSFHTPDVFKTREKAETLKSWPCAFCLDMVAKQRFGKSVEVLCNEAVAN